MTFAQMQARLYKSVQRDDLLVANSADDNYGTFVNEALKEIQQQKNWTFMKDTTQLTILAGSSSVNLPADFKTFQNVRPPTHIVLTDPATNIPVLRPVNVTWGEQEWRRTWMLGAIGGVGTIVWDLRVFSDRVSGTKSLNITTPAAENLIFQVKYYRYLPVLAEDSDTSLIETLYPQMVFNKAKEIAFNFINDYEARDNAEGEYAKKFIAASKQDNYDDVSGREGRM